MYQIVYSEVFLEQLKRVSEEITPKQIAEIRKLINLLSSGVKLPKSYHNHPRKARWKNYIGCHIPLSDLVLLYQIEGDKIILKVIGRHDIIF